MKQYFTIITYIIFNVVITFQIDSCTAKTSSFDTAKSRERMLEMHQRLLHLKFLDPIDQITVRKPSRDSSYDHEENICRTDIAELAECFQDAIVTANQHQEDIHVGNLLSASERLGLTMRRIGFNQSAKDIVGNIRKIRNVYEKLPASCRDSMPALLRYEISSGIVDPKKGNKLPENSATCGFLWLGRSLNYQYDMFSHMLENEKSNPFEAASIAYDRDLKPHLSWPLQKVCQAAMTTLKTRRQKDIFAKIGGFPEENFGEREEQATKQDLRHVMQSLEPMLYRWNQVFSDLELGSI